MLEAVQIVRSWLAAVLLAAVPWLVRYQPAAAPLAAALSLALDPPWRLRGPQPFFRHGLVALSALAFLLMDAGWRVGGAWLLLAAVVAAAAWWSWRRGGPRPDAGDAVLLLGWGGAFLVHPATLLPQGGGWLAPLLLLISLRRLVDAAAGPAAAKVPVPVPPSREVEGFVELEGVVLRGEDDLRRSAPLHLDIRPGQSVAVLCDVAEDSELLALTIAGRRKSLEGRVLIDGAESRSGEAVTAVIAPGEPFVAGSVDDNLAACVTGELSDAARAAVEEACSLDDVRAEVAGSGIAADGSPLSPFHRLLLQTARIIPSHYRILVVIDPEPWVNRVRAEMWRSAVVRASTGRTAVWITPDRDLASRAEHCLEWRHGRLVPFDSEGIANPGGVS